MRSLPTLLWEFSPERSLGGVPPQNRSVAPLDIPIRTAVPSLTADTIVRERLAVPPKLRELIRDLVQAGFVDRGGKGIHRNFVHPSVQKPVVISGKPGDDALTYQIKAVRKAIEEAKK